MLISKRIVNGEERRGRSDSSAGLALLYEEPKASSPQSALDFSLRPALLHPADPTIPIVPDLAFGLRECSRQIYIAAFSDPTASALVGTLGQMGRECQGRARQRRGRGQPTGAPTPRGDPSRATIQTSTLMET